MMEEIIVNLVLYKKKNKFKEISSNFGEREGKFKGYIYILYQVEGGGGCCFGCIVGVGVIYV